MEELYKRVLVALQNEDKEQAVSLSIHALKEKRVSVYDLYEMVLVPALNHVVDEYRKDEELIWREHVRSAIIRTIIESAYPYVLEEKKKAGINKGKVIVMCPEYEDHELGAKMVSDFFNIEGYDSTFVGARTPENTIVQAINIIRPRFLCISVTNYYHLVSVKKTIESIKEKIQDDLTFVVGGRAFDGNPESYTVAGADVLLKSYEDIRNLYKEEM